MASLFAILRCQIIDSSRESHLHGYQDRRRRVYRMLRTWTSLEPLIAFGILICGDLVATSLVQIPARSLSCLCRCLLRRSWPNPSEYRNFAMVGLMTLVVLCVRFANHFCNLSYSYYYHALRRQSYFTVFFAFNVIIVLDRICSMFGVDLVGRAINFHPRRGWVELVQDVVVCVVYALVHIVILYLQIITINVAVNSHRGELVIVLTSNNFSEIKAGVLKKFSVVNVFQISMGDVVERFQTMSMITAIVVHQLIAMDSSDILEFGQRMSLVAIWMMFTESMVDWIKHGFINRFNNVSPRVYGDFALLLSYDYVNHRANIARRIGLVPLPIVTIIVSGMLHICEQFQSFYQQIGITKMALGVCVICILAFAIKTELEVYITGKSLQLIERNSASFSEEMWHGVERYKLSGFQKVQLSASAFVLVKRMQCVGWLLSVHADSVWAVKWSPTAIITAGIDSAVKFWQASSLLDLGSDASPTPTSVFDGHSLAIVSVAMNPSSTIAASSAMDGFVITYDITEPKQLKKIDVGPSKNWCVSLSDQLLATGGYEGKAQIYNYHSGDNLSSSIAIDNPFVLAVQFNASGSRLALGGSKGEAALFDPVTGQVVEKLQGYTKGIRCIEFAASDNNVVLIGGESNSIILFDVRSGYHIASLACHSHWVMGLASHPTRAGVERFASCSSDKTVKVWDLRSRNVLHLFDKCHSDQVTGVAFSPDGNMLVSVSDDASMQFYNSPQ